MGRLAKSKIKERQHHVEISDKWKAHAAEKYKKEHEKESGEVKKRASKNLPGGGGTVLEGGQGKDQGVKNKSFTVCKVISQRKKGSHGGQSQRKARWKGLFKDQRSLKSEGDEE
jgi:hypothetical protein